jgi:hypothetical protein
VLALQDAELGLLLGDDLLVVGSVLGRLAAPGEPGRIVEDRRDVAPTPRWKTSWIEGSFPAATYRKVRDRISVQ